MTLDTWDRVRRTSNSQVIISREEGGTAKSPIWGRKALIHPDWLTRDVRIEPANAYSLQTFLLFTDKHQESMWNIQRMLLPFHPWMNGDDDILEA